MEAKLWHAVYRHVLSLAHRRRPREQFDDRIIVLVMLRAAAFGQPVSWACQAGNWPGGFDRPLPSDSTVSRRRRSLGVQQLWERALSAASDLLEGPAGAPARPPLVKAIDSKPLFVGAYSKDRHAKRGHIAAGQKARGYRLHALCHGRGVRRFVIGSMDEHDSRAAPQLLERLEGGGYVVADNAYDANDLHARAAWANHQLVSPPRPCNRGVRDLGHNCACRLRSLDIMDSPLTRHAGPDAFGRGLYNCRVAAESCFGELSYLGLNYLPAWIRGPHRVAWWAAAKIIVCLCRQARRKGLMG